MFPFRPWFALTLIALLAACNPAGAQVPTTDPANEPSVLAVRKALPAVVNINTERIVRRTVQDPLDAFFEQFYGGPMRPPRQLQQKVQNLGSGFLIDPNGYIVTNEHVVERAADLKIQVTLSDGQTHSARYIAGNAEADLALIKIESPKPLPFIDLKDLSPNYLGQSVLALGNPLGYGLSVSRGILSATNRTVAFENEEFSGLLQTDAAINPGNSGGPIVDLAGKLVGVSSAKMAYSPQGVPTQGLGFAIPGATVRERVAEFMKIAKEGPKKVESASQRLFGFQVQDLTEDLTEAFGYLAGKGVLIADVQRASPAEKAGFKRGLVIYKVGRYEVNSSAELEELLAQASSGTQVDFTVGAVRQIRGRLVQQIETVSLRGR